MTTVTTLDRCGLGYDSHHHSNIFCFIFVFDLQWMGMRPTTDDMLVDLTVETTRHDALLQVDH
jgi:hypothetical protein